MEWHSETENLSRPRTYCDLYLAHHRLRQTIGRVCFALSRQPAIFKYVNQNGNVTQYVVLYYVETMSYCIICLFGIYFSSVCVRNVIIYASGWMTRG